MTPEEYCQDKTAKSGSSFYYSFLFLPKEKRMAITAVYAFCREVDDVVDNPGENQIKHIKLQWWREEITRLFNAQAQHPVTLALTSVIERYNLPEEYFQEIIDGMQMDLDQTSYANFKELSLYCYRAAGVVGLISAEIFGYQDRQTLKYASNLGTAFQLTNIIRDIHEDAQRGRFYLPQDELKKFNVSQNELTNGTESDKFRQLLKYQIERAREYYQKAYSLLPDTDRYSQTCGLIMADIYSSILDEIEINPDKLLHQRIHLHTLKKLWIALTSLYRERRLHRRSTKQHA